MLFLVQSPFFTCQGSRLQDPLLVCSDHALHCVSHAVNLRAVSLPLHLALYVVYACRQEAQEVHSAAQASAEVRPGRCSIRVLQHTADA